MARLHEYQGKAILAANEFTISRGRAAFSRLMRSDPNAVRASLSFHRGQCSCLGVSEVSDNPGTSKRMFVKVVQADFED